MFGKWYLSSKSAGFDTGSLSILGLAETLLASSVALFLVYYFDAYLFLLVATVTVPFALLKTKQSSLRANDLCSLLIVTLDKLPKSHKSIANVIFAFAPGFCNRSSFVKTIVTILCLFTIGYIRGIQSLLFLLIIITSRWYATIHSLYHDFWSTIKVIPLNWTSICLGSDYKLFPEVIPGEKFPEAETRRFHVQFLEWHKIEILPYLTPNIDHPRYLIRKINQMIIFLLKNDFIGLISSTFFAIPTASFLTDVLEASNPGYFGHLFELSLTAKIVMYALSVPISFYAVCIVSIFLWAHWYRVSLKATAILWLPLLYIASDSVAEKLSVDTRLHCIRDSVFNSFMRRVAVITIAVNISIVGAKFAYHDLYSTMSEHILYIKLMYGKPSSIAIGIWTIASVVNAFMALGLYCLADAELRRRKFKNGYSDQIVAKGLNSIYLIRWVLFLFTLSCTTYIFVDHIRKSPHHPFDLQYVPWLDEKISINKQTESAP